MSFWMSQVSIKEAHVKVARFVHLRELTTGKSKISVTEDFASDREVVLVVRVNGNIDSQADGVESKRLAVVSLGTVGFAGFGVVFRNLISPCGAI